MGMLNRKVLLLGVAGLGGIALLVDQTLLSKAAAGVAELGSVVQEVKKAQAIAGSLESGGPDALHGLLDALAADEGVTPGEASPGLFGELLSMSVAVDAEAISPQADRPTGPDRMTTEVPPVATHRVSMVMTGAGGGVALIDGHPLRAGESRDGLTLLEVRDDGVSVRKGTQTHFIALD